MHHVDLHLHLLPGVDDGPDDEAASLTHAERLARDGVHEATVTPHIGHPWFPLDVATIPERTRALQAALDAAGIDLRLHPGGEIYPAGATGARRGRARRHRPRPARRALGPARGARSPASTRRTSPPAPTSASSGFGLLIGHPERALGFLRGGHALLRDEIAAGALLQVNVCSLLGRQGPEALAGARHAGPRRPRLRAGLRRARRHPRAHARGRRRPPRAGPASRSQRSRQLTEVNPRLPARERDPGRALDRPLAA